jgi:hypothetical protein
MFPPACRRCKHDTGYQRGSLAPVLSARRLHPHDLVSDRAPPHAQADAIDDPFCVLVVPDLSPALDHEEVSCSTLSPSRGSATFDPGRMYPTGYRVSTPSSTRRPLQRPPHRPRANQAVNPTTSLSCCAQIRPHSSAGLRSQATRNRGALRARNPLCEKACSSTCRCRLPGSNGEILGGKTA